MKQTTPITEPLMPGEDEADRANRLRASGISILQIAEALNKSERQVYRILGHAKNRSSKGTFDKWSLWSSRNNDEPVAMLKYLFETDGESGWLQEEAPWAWRISCVRPNLDPQVVRAFARMYRLIDKIDESDRPFRARLLDLALQNEVWVDEEHRRNYFGLAPARNSADLEYIARVAWFLEHVNGASGELVTLKLASIVENPIETLESMVDRMQEELESDKAKVKLITEPGQEESDR